MKKLFMSIILMGFLFTASVTGTPSFGTNELLKDEELSAPSIPYANIYVDGKNTQGPWDGTYCHPYRYIQDGINHASDNDIVFVYSGIYNGNIFINKPLKLFGENQTNTIIDGEHHGDTIRIKSSFVNIKGINIINSSRDGFSGGIKVRDHPNRLEDITISNCIINNGGCGLHLGYIDKTSVSNCIIHGNICESIYIQCLDDVTIDNCDIYENGEYFDDIMWKNGGITADGKNINIFDCKIHNNAGQGIFISGSYNGKICQNTISENMEGIALSGASNFEIINNNVTKNSHTEYYSGNGVHILFSDNVLISNNFISENCFPDQYEGGINIDYSYNITVKSNIFSFGKSFWVIALYCKDNKIIKNNFIDNYKHAFFHYDELDQSNNWDGNYWSGSIIVPKIILGFMSIELGKHLWFEFDWHPAKQPYDIEV